MSKTKRCGRKVARRSHRRKKIIKRTMKKNIKEVARRSKLEQKKMKAQMKTLTKNIEEECVSDDSTTNLSVDQQEMTSESFKQKIAYLQNVFPEATEDNLGAILVYFNYDETKVVDELTGVISESSKQKIDKIHDIFHEATKANIANILKFYDDDETKAVDALTRDGGEEALRCFGYPSSLKNKKKGRKGLDLAGSSTAKVNLWFDDDFSMFESNELSSENEDSELEESNENEDAVVKKEWCPENGINIFALLSATPSFSKDE